MQHFITPYTGEAQNFVYWENGFSEKELNNLQFIARDADVDATIGSGDTDPEKSNRVRRSLVKWVNKTTESEWIFNKLSHIVSDVNSRYFRFDLAGFGEPMQLTNYISENAGNYDWHIDMGGQVSRKLSITLQLSHPWEYEGGTLELYNSNDITEIPKQRGLMTIFPSWNLHRVTPVTKGSRQSLVLWVSGSPFR
jgi:PKHD-type hydroxylase